LHRLRRETAELVQVVARHRQHPHLGPPRRRDHPRIPILEKLIPPNRSPIHRTLDPLQHHLIHLRGILGQRGGTVWVISHHPPTDGRRRDGEKSQGSQHGRCLPIPDRCFLYEHGQWSIIIACTSLVRLSF